jgi:hypothetical protein
MSDFNPSADFVSRVMAEVKSYETVLEQRSSSHRSFPFSRPAVLALSSGGVLLAIFNIIRMVVAIMTPAYCF